MGRTAGRANWMWLTNGFVANLKGTEMDVNTAEITINPDYCQNGHWEDILNNTLPHEYAHILAGFIYGRTLGDGHGHGWRVCMNVLGLPAKRCHKYSMEGVKTKVHVKWEYKCNCRTHYVGKKVHEKIQYGAPYYCKSCRARIVYQQNFGKGIDQKKEES
jgi:predicted SprT family Zn-dependent metalloprotease